MLFLSRDFKLVGLFRCRDGEYSRMKDRNFGGALPVCIRKVVLRRFTERQQPPIPGWCLWFSDANGCIGSVDFVETVLRTFA